MDAAKAIGALVSAGVQPDASVHAEIDSGDLLCAFIDTIGLADEQQVVIPVDLAHDVRNLFDRMHLRPESKLRASVNEVLLRVERRAATAA